MPSSNVGGFLIALLSHDLTSTTGIKVLSEAERTATLYSLLQHSTQVQIRLFITVLQQMARVDHMTALSEPGRRGFHAEPDGSQTCQYESQVSRTQVSTCPLPPLPVLSIPARRTASRWPSTLPPPHLPIPPIPSATQSTPRQHSLNSVPSSKRCWKTASNAAHRISAPALASSDAGELGRRQFTWPGRGAQ